MQFFDRVPSSEDRTGTSGASEHSEEEESESDDDEEEAKRVVPPQVASTNESRGGGIDELLAAEIDEIRTKKKVCIAFKFPCSRVSRGHMTVESLSHEYTSF